MNSRYGKVEVYSTENCPGCVTLKNILKSANVEFNEIDVLGTGLRSVPQLYLDGRFLMMGAVPDKKAVVALLEKGNKK